MAHAANDAHTSSDSLTANPYGKKVREKSAKSPPNPFTGLFLKSLPRLEEADFLLQKSGIELMFLYLLKHVKKFVVLIKIKYLLIIELN